LKEFKHIRLTPRWEATGVKEAEVRIEYPATSAYVKYKYLSSEEFVTLKIEGSSEMIDLELYLPENRRHASSSVKGGEMNLTGAKKTTDKYFRCSIKKISPSIELTIILS
jgi:hypothetical protein